MKNKIKELPISNPPKFEMVFSLFTSHFSPKRRAFTLAEVLITLGVIGIVAALTLPMFIAKYQEKIWVNGFFRTYTLLENAYKNAQQEYGTFNEWGDDFEVRPDGHRLTSNGLIIYNNLIKPYIKVNTVYLSNPNLCMPETYSHLDGKPANGLKWQTPAVSLPSGECIILGRSGCDFFVDINGKKGPNVLGKDMFYFSFDGTKPERIKPGNMELKWTDTANYCDFRSNHGWNAGTSCGFWIMRNRNMDYLHMPFDELKAKWNGGKW